MSCHACRPDFKLLGHPLDDTLLQWRYARSPDWPNNDTPGHFLLESGHHGDLWLDLELLCLRPRQIEPSVGTCRGDSPGTRWTPCMGHSRRGLLSC